MITFFKRFFTARTPKPCRHGFDIKEVMNLSVDPICKHCGEKLSILTQKSLVESK